MHASRVGTAVPKDRAGQAKGHLSPPRGYRSPIDGLCGLLHDTERHVRGAGDAGVESARIGMRVLPEDGLPVVGHIPGHENLYVCATHSGVTLAPLIAELAADELLQDADSALLRTFRPARFAAAHS